MAERNYQCPAPFVSLYYHTDGKMAPCGHMNVSELQSIEDYKNSDRLKGLKQDILQNKRSELCQHCHKLEDYELGSMRRYWLKEVGIEGCKESEFEYVEVKFSSLCNSKCRICYPQISSQIATEEIKFNKEYDKPALVTPGGELFLLEQIKTISKGIKILTFSGGEPLLHWQHYDLLNHLIENNLNPALIYYSNVSTLSLKNEYIFDKWKHFSNIEFRASVDAIGDAANYWRPGEPFDIIFENIKSIKTNMPHIDLQYTVTTAWPMMYRMPELITAIYEFHNEPSLNLNMVNNKLYNPRVLPLEYKNKLKDQLSNFIKTFPVTTKLERDVNNLIDYMYGEDWTNILENSIAEIIKFDKRRNQSFLSVFPEFTELVEKYGRK